MYCKNCGNELPDDAKFCANCGASTGSEEQLSSDQNYRTASCPRCGSHDISYQREQTSSFGGSRTTYKARGSHGCLYFLVIGWWVAIFKFMLAIGTMGISLLFTRRRRGVVGKTVTADKTINRTMAVCQNCGKSWKV